MIYRYLFEHFFDSAKKITISPLNQGKSRKQLIINNILKIPVC